MTIPGNAKFLVSGTSTRNGAQHVSGPMLEPHTLYSLSALHVGRVGFSLTSLCVLYVLRSLKSFLCTSGRQRFANDRLAVDMVVVVRLVCDALDQ